MTNYLGGHRLLSARRLSRSSVRIRFESDRTTHVHQVYAGRRLLGSTRDPLQRQITVRLEDAEWGDHLTLLAVPLTDRLTDFGTSLPARPGSRVRVAATIADGTRETRAIELTAGIAPGAAVDDSHIVASFPWTGNRSYRLDSVPLPGTGTWNLEVRSVQLSGRRGDPLALSAEVLAIPPDVTPRHDGSRARITVTTGTVVAEVTP